MVLSLRKECGSSGWQVLALMGHLEGSRPEKTAFLLKSTLSSYSARPPGVPWIQHSRVSAVVCVGNTVFLCRWRRSTVYCDSDSMLTLCPHVHLLSPEADANAAETRDSAQQAWAVITGRREGPPLDGHACTRVQVTLFGVLQHSISALRLRCNGDWHRKWRTEQAAPEVYMS